MNWIFLLFRTAILQTCKKKKKKKKKKDKTFWTERNGPLEF